MNIRIAAAVVATLTASLTIAAAQPEIPRNLRLATKATEGPAPSPCEVPDVGGGAHAYFDSLVRRSEHFCSWSLRSQAQLDDIVPKGPSTFFTYDPINDTYPDKQDAAKLVRPDGGSSSVPGAQQLYFNVNDSLKTGTVLITWDWYWGKEFRLNRGGVNAWKMFQVMVGGHRWWSLMANLAWVSATDTTEVTKVSDEFASGQLADGVITRDPFSPSGAGAPDARNKSGRQYAQHHSTWTRYWIEVRYQQPPSAFVEWSKAYLGGATLRPNPDDPAGRWHMVSLWSADERRDVSRLLFQAPLNWHGDLGWNPWITRFRFEMNTSQPPLSLTGPLIGYGRNVVILHNYSLPTVPETDAYLFRRPSR